MIPRKKSPYVLCTFEGIAITRIDQIVAESTVEHQVTCKACPRSPAARPNDTDNSMMQHQPGVCYFFKRVCN